MPDQIGHYMILERIGAGSLGEVFRARDTRLGRTVAIKVADPRAVGDLQQQEQLLADARGVMALSHPHAATLFDAGSDDEGNPYLVFEFVPGSPLRTIVHGQPLNPRRAIDLAIQLADALAEAHALGLHHLALSPDTIFVTPKGAAKILDVGFSRWRRSAGTTAYSAPEQVRTSAVDHRADVFALGAVLYEMLTGRSPFAGSTPADIARAVLEETPRPPSQVRKEIPRELDPIVMRAIAKRLENRYQGAVTFGADLRVVNVTTEDRRTASAPVVIPAAPRDRRMTPVIWVMVALAAAAAIWFVTM
jgi:serine/threonine protein kinase